jgi:TFIIIC subunit triple barrel domain
LKRRKLDVQSKNDGDDPSSFMTPAGTNPQLDEEAAYINEPTQDGPETAQSPTPTASQANDIQILDLHGQNPVVSYQNQIYHCTWSDMIGTAMFFSKAEGQAEEDALMYTDDFQLIHTSRIKLIGQKANLSGKPGRKRPRQAADSLDEIDPEAEDVEDNPIINGKSLGEIRTSNAKINADIKRQAAFLEKLMEIKRTKGESDNVRTVFSPRKGSTSIIQPRNSSSNMSRHQEQFPSTAKEIEELNKRVVRGDADALTRLQDIYSSMEDGSQNRLPQQSTPAAPSESPDNRAAGANIFEQHQAPNK